jgi:hypothetical protein
MVVCESRPSTIGLITLDTKQTGAPSAGAGNGFTVWLLRHSQRKRGAKKLGQIFGTPRQSSTRPARLPLVCAAEPRERTVKVRLVK